MRVHSKRIIGAAAAVLGAITALVPAVPAAAAPAPCTAEVTMRRWGASWSPSTGLVAIFKLTNNTIGGITDFRVNFRSPKVIGGLNLWGQHITHSQFLVSTLWWVTPHSGNPQMGVPPEDPNMPPGRTIEFGLQGQVDGQHTDAPPETVIRNVFLAGKACEVIFV